MTVKVVLEFMHDKNRELVESAVLATLLRHKVYLEAFLKAVDRSWKVSEPIATRTEVTMPGPAYADIEVTWEHCHQRYQLLIENKPYSTLTKNQPKGYVYELDNSDARFKAFAFIYSDTEAYEELKVKLKQHLPSSSRGQVGMNWNLIRRGMMARSKGAIQLHHAPLPDVMQCLRAVDEEDETRRWLRDWLCTWHAAPRCNVGKQKRKAFKKLIRGIERLEDLEKSLDDGYYGVCPWYADRSRHGGKEFYLWLGVEPDTAESLGYDEKQVLLQTIGWRDLGDVRLFQDLERALGRPFVSVHASTKGPSWAMPINSRQELETVLERLATQD